MQKQDYEDLMVLLVGLASKEMKNEKTAGADGIPIELVKCLGEGKKEILSLCNKI